MSDPGVRDTTAWAAIALGVFCTCLLAWAINIGSVRIAWAACLNAGFGGDHCLEAMP